MKITKPDDAHVLPHPVQQALEVGSMVQFGNPVQYGVIKVIRKDPYSNAKLAEIETVSTNKLAAMIHSYIRSLYTNACV